MEFRYPPRVYVLLVVAGVMTIAASISHLAVANAYEDPYPFRTQFARLAALKPLLAGIQKVGYLSDIKPDDPGFTRLYFPTQYVLAPTLLVPLAGAQSWDLVVGNFTRQADYAAIGGSLGLEVVKEFPMGVVLYRPAKGSSPPEAAQASGTQ